MVVTSIDKVYSVTLGVSNQGRMEDKTIRVKRVKELGGHGVGKIIYLYTKITNFYNSNSVRETFIHPGFSIVRVKPNGPGVG